MPKTTNTLDQDVVVMDAPGREVAFSVLEAAGGKTPAGQDQFDHDGEVLEVDPPRVLVYAWFGNWHEQPEHRTVVRWELAPTTKGTLVRVTHSGLAQFPAARTGYSQGWPGLLEALRKFFEK